MSIVEQDSLGPDEIWFRPKSQPQFAEWELSEEELNQISKKPRDVRTLILGGVRVVRFVI